MFDLPQVVVFLFRGLEMQISNVKDDMKRQQEEMLENVDAEPAKLLKKISDLEMKIARAQDAERNNFENLVSFEEEKLNTSPGKEQSENSISLKKF